MNTKQVLRVIGLVGILTMVAMSFVQPAGTYASGEILVFNGVRENLDNPWPPIHFT